MRVHVRRVRARACMYIGCARACACTNAGRATLTVNNCLQIPWRTSHIRVRARTHTHTHTHTHNMQTPWPTSRIRVRARTHTHKHTHTHICCTHICCVHTHLLRTRCWRSRTICRHARECTVAGTDLASRERIVSSPPKATTVSPRHAW